MDWHFDTIDTCLSDQDGGNTGDSSYLRYDNVQHYADGYTAIWSGKQYISEYRQVTLEEALYILSTLCRFSLGAALRVVHQSRSS